MSLLQLMVFTNLFFTSNHNLFLQINYVIYLINASNTANILYWFSIKYKQVTKSVFALKLYAIAHSFNIGPMLKAIVFQIF